MVDQSDLDTIAALNSELHQIRTALEVLDAGGRIASMTVITGIDVVSGARVTVETSTMAYPPQMIETIKIYLGNREQEIRNQLAALGVTGVDAPTPLAPSPTTTRQQRRA